MLDLLENFQNLDLFSVGIAVAGMLVLGFVVLFNDLKSTTNKMFLLLAVSASMWGAVNYASYQPFGDPELSLLLVRIALFFSIWAALTTFAFIYSFPEKKFKFSKFFVFGLLPVAVVVSLLSLTPLVLESVTKLSIEGGILKIANGPAIFLYALLIGFLNIGAIVFLVRKIMKAEKQAALFFILLGLILMLVPISVFNFVLPAFFDDSRFIALAGIFQLPFIVFAAYAVLRHGLFNIKVAGASLLVFAIAVLTLSEVVNADSISLLIFRAIVFGLVLLFGISLIRSVIREVRQRKKIEELAQRLGKANERLKELDRQKSEFVSIASHQLRSPMTAIRGYISLILDKEFGVYPKNLQEPLSKIDESARLMTNSIEDYLNISRIEQGRMKYEMSNFDVTDLVRVVVDEYIPVAEKKGLDLIFNYGEKITVRADMGKIKQVIANLIDNAIKYTPRGNITAKTSVFADRTRITVSDTGVGISKENIDDLFNKFIRARDANKINTSGTGLGLYVAKQIVEAHDGRVWVESEGKNKGSRFIIELPLASAEAS